MIAARSPIVRLGVRVITPPAVLVAIQLFFAGHNRPGGGFAAGLVLGAVLALRAIAGLRTPGPSATFLWVGAALAASTAVAPIVLDGTVLDQKVVEITVPLLGKVKSGSALVFDIGVTSIVMGLVTAVLEGLDVARVADRGPSSGPATMAEENR